MMNKQTLDNKFNKRELKHQDKNNELHQYCKIMDNLKELGFFYREAKEYALTMVKRRYK